MYNTGETKQRLFTIRWVGFSQQQEKERKKRGKERKKKGKERERKGKRGGTERDSEGKGRVSFGHREPSRLCRRMCPRRRLRSTKGLLRSGGNCAKCTPAECHPQYRPKSAAEDDSSAACIMIAVFTVTVTATVTEENRKSVNCRSRLVRTTRINLIAGGLRTTRIYQIQDRGPGA
jgi:hypothetical protein